MCSRSESISRLDGSFHAWGNVGPTWGHDIDHFSVHVVHVALIELAIVIIDIGVVRFSGSKAIPIAVSELITGVQISAESIEFTSVMHVADMFTSIGIIGTRPTIGYLKQKKLLFFAANFLCFR